MTNVRLSACDENGVYTFRLQPGTNTFMLVVDGAQTLSESSLVLQRVTEAEARSWLANACENCVL